MEHLPWQDYEMSQRDMASELGSHNGFIRTCVLDITNDTGTWGLWSYSSPEARVGGRPVGSRGWPVVSWI